jgi:hypothetical protein
MPVIREYNQQISAPGPIQRTQYTAEMFGAAEGRAMVAAGEAVSDVAGAVAKRLDQENTSDITAKVTKANADLAIDLQDTIRKAEPGDKKAFEEYEKRVDETLGKIGDEATTVSARGFYTEASARIKGQLYKTSADGQAELAGIKAVNDYSGSLNNLSAAAAADPSSILLQRELHKQAIQNLVNTGSLPAHKALELQREGDASIVKSSVRGWAELDPEYARKKLKSGEYDEQLGAEGKKQLIGEIDQAVRAKEIDAERRRAEGERITKVKQQQTQNDFLSAMQENKLTTKDILNSNLEAFGSGSKEQFLQMMKIANSPEQKLKTDANTMIALYDRIHLPDGDPKKLVDENELNNYFGRGLSMSDMNQLRDEMQGKQTEAGRVESDLKKQVMDIARGKLTKSNPLTGMRDPTGDEQMQRFMVFFMDEYKQQRSKGVSAVELLSPDSPKYLGKNITQYVRTPQQIMRDMAPKRSAPADGGLAGTLTGTQPAGAATPIYRAPEKKATPRQPNESAAEYLKRVKGGQ